MTGQREAGYGRGSLRRDVAFVVLLKLAALMLLWALCFSPAHRPPADPASTSHHLGLSAPTSVPASGPPHG
jgi:hypothetical protein